jgi:hypothetical protein
MPLLALHMTAARAIASTVGSKRIEADTGAYYLGATTPDIRALTKQPREHTHFFMLDDFGAQSGVHRLFEAQPQLREAATLDASTAAFMAGYITHLVLDEEYICQVYRPCFGERSALADDKMANVMDRLLQFDMDARERADAEAVAEIRSAIEATAADVAVDFIAREDLRRWRALQIEMLERPPDLKRMLSRHLLAAGRADEEAMRRFHDEEAAPLLRATIERLGEERIREYIESARRKAERAVREYLS